MGRKGRRRPGGKGGRGWSIPDRWQQHWGIRAVIKDHMWTHTEPQATRVPVAGVPARILLIERCSGVGDGKRMGTFYGHHSRTIQVPSTSRMEVSDDLQGGSSFYAACRRKGVPTHEGYGGASTSIQAKREAPKIREHLRVQLREGGTREEPRSGREPARWKGEEDDLIGGTLCARTINGGMRGSGGERGCGGSVGKTGGSPPASMVAMRELGSVPSRGAGYRMRSRGRFRAQRVLDPVALLEFERSHLEFLRVVASVTLLIIPHDAHDQQILEPSQVYVHGRSADARLWYPRRARSSSFHGNFHVGRWDGALLPRWQTSVKFALTRAGLRVMHVVQPEGSWPSATSIPEGVFVYLAFQLLIPEEEEGETQDDFGEKGCHRRAKLGCEDTVQMCREATVTVTARPSRRRRRGRVTVTTTSVANEKR
ncbi:hypothetical protein B0H11DRAFT_2368578 [Mycena galericulata]|nr:hypothetical protein B0H11DRAFT_2368578 [Mycena galericulata]